MALVLALLNCSREPGTLSFADWGKGRIIRELDAQISALGLGTHTGSLDVQRDPAYASGVLAMSGGATAVGGTIGGKLVTATWATSDANSCDLVAAAILADTTANKFVTAVSRAATGTITISGGSGVVTATLSAPAAAVSQQSQAQGNLYSLTWATSDAVTATALAALINADGDGPCIAVASAGVVTLYARPDGKTGAANTDGNLIALAVTGTGVTKSGAVLSGGGTNANVVVQALLPGTVGLGITLAASGTGVTAPTGANLVAGVGAPGNSFTC
jgi:hypothetical protein